MSFTSAPSHTTVEKGALMISIALLNFTVCIPYLRFNKDIRYWKSDGDTPLYQKSVIDVQRINHRIGHPNEGTHESRGSGTERPPSSLSDPRVDGLSQHGTHLHFMGRYVLPDWYINPCYHGVTDTYGYTVRPHITIPTSNHVDIRTSGRA